MVSFRDYNLFDPLSNNKTLDLKNYVGEKSEITKIDLIITPETIALDKFFEVTIDRIVYSYYSFSTANANYNDRTHVIPIYYAGVNETLNIGSLVIEGIGSNAIYSAYLRIYYVTCN